MSLKTLEYFFTLELASARAPGRPRWCVRLQVQTGRQHLASDGAPCPTSGGVTVAQARDALARCDQKLAGSHPGVHRDSQNAVADMHATLGTFPPHGVQGGNLNIARKFFRSGRRRYRVDAENIIGHNLRR
jgi:hypothetical protein